ncbi:hypothetical protein [Planococcus halotolerans]|uniref:Uncharacterized protein n=1 Tax=Planococcus halotolerans TaxID=2233542 RepID=A0A365L3B2_9BACL|nr:hypothetical protein [Planococcus halotolerans]RAZ79539.1 hypothetical protein DP120_07995 [Planococcus halotolerans]
MKKVVTYSFTAFLAAFLLVGTGVYSSQVTDKVSQPENIKFDVADKVPQPWSLKFDVADKVPQPWSNVSDNA